MLLIVGLGNPGAAYQGTRHNIGFVFIDRLSEAYGIACGKAGWMSSWGRGMVAGEDVVLVKPQTFMNASGEAVAWFIRSLELSPCSVLVAYDDCDLPTGRLRIRKGGGSGGHKGIDSISACIGSTGFPRIRLGIGRPEAGELSDYVLSPFTDAEHGPVEEMLGKGVRSVEVIITEGIDSAMNRFNPAE